MGNAESMPLTGGLTPGHALVTPGHPHTLQRGGATADTPEAVAPCACSSAAATRPVFLGEDVAFKQDGQLWTSADVQAICSVSGACALTVRRLLREAETLHRTPERTTQPETTIRIREYMK